LVQHQIRAPLYSPVERLGVHHEDRQETRVHVLNFNHLYEQIKRSEIDEPWRNQIEARHNLFPDLDFRVYA
jgi:predicted glycosyl hydrolase (DUF1957 family)